MKAAQSESGATACVVTEAQAGSSGSSSQQQQTQQQKEGNEPLVVLNSEASCDGVPPPSTAGLFELETRRPFSRRPAARFLMY